MRKSSGLIGIAVALAACNGSGDERLAPATKVASGPLARAFASSAARAHVPRDLLVAIAVVEDGLTVPARRLEVGDTHVPSAGPLMLRRGRLDTLARGAAKVSRTEEDLRRDADLALEAGALVLSELGRDTGAREDDLSSWRSAIEEMSGYADDAHREHYAHRLFATLAHGGRFEGRDGETITLASHDVPPTLVLDLSDRLRALSDAVAQVPGAEWVPTSCKHKCTPTRDGAKIERIVIHDTEGGWDASLATLQNDPGKSAHYLVGTDGRLAQFVAEETTAWHAGNYWYNQRSVGVEHVGYARKAFPDEQYDASARLVAHLTAKYGLAVDREHVIGHDQVPDGTRIADDGPPCASAPSVCQESGDYGGAGNHSDPGVWEWTTFMERIGGHAKCNDASSLWTCSHAATRAFRCAGGVIEVLACDGLGGCEGRPDGQDHVCHVLPAGAPAPEPEEPAPAPPLALAPPPQADEPEGGCAVVGSNRAHDGESLAACAALAALCALVRGRSRSRRVVASSRGQ